MKMINPILLFLGTLVLFTSCSISKYTAPPFTDVDKILELEPGKTIDQVTELLKVKPYDVVYAHDSGKKILIYNYRVRDRRMPVRTNSSGLETHNEESQRKGEPWYNDNHRELFLLFEGDNLTNVYGEDALSIAGYLNVLDSQLDGNPTTGSVAQQSQDYMLVQGVYQDRQLKKQAASIEEDQRVKKRNKLLVGGAALLVLGIISVF